MAGNIGLGRMGPYRASEAGGVGAQPRLTHVSPPRALAPALLRPVASAACRGERSSDGEGGTRPAWARRVPGVRPRGRRKRSTPEPCSSPGDGCEDDLAARPAAPGARVVPTRPYPSRQLRAAIGGRRGWPVTPVVWGDFTVLKPLKPLRLRGAVRRVSERCPGRIFVLSRPRVSGLGGHPGAGSRCALA